MNCSLLDEIVNAGFQESEMKMPGLFRYVYLLLKYMLDIITTFNYH